MKVNLKKNMPHGIGSSSESDPASPSSNGSPQAAGVEAGAYTKPSSLVVLPSRFAKNQFVARASFISRGASSKTIFVETIRNPKNSAQLLFLVCKDGKQTIVPHVEQSGKLCVPPETGADALAELRLPGGTLPCGDSREMLSQICSEVSKYVDLSADDALLVSVFILSSWFPDCVKVAPYLWLVGPLGSGKTTLLRLLHCFCRRALLIADLTPASLYKLSNLLHPTLLLDEFESSNSSTSAAVHRLLRAGSTLGASVARNGQLYSTFGYKVISSRQPTLDGALASRALLIRCLPTKKNLLPLDEAAATRLASVFQSKLLMFRLEHHSGIADFRLPFADRKGLSSRMADIAHAMVAPLQGDVVSQAKLLRVLRGREEDAQVERLLEPEWLVVEALFDLCHQVAGHNHGIGAILVGGLSAQINEVLKFRGEDLILGARKVGAVLQSLGVRTTRLGNTGRGVKLTAAVKEQIHGLAQQLGLDRRHLATMHGLESGFGGLPCALCERFGLTGGLRFVDVKRQSRRRPPAAYIRRPLFAAEDGLDGD